MGQAVLVKDRIEDGRKLLDLLAVEHLEASVTFWQYTSDEDQWTLNIASPQIDSIGLRESYRAVIVAIRNHPDLAIRPEDVMLLRPRDPLATAFLDYATRNPSPTVAHIHGIYLAGILVEDAYLYPKIQAP